MELAPLRGWDTFVAQHWQKRAVHMRNALGAPFCGDALIFSTLIAASDQLREGESVNLRVFVERAMRTADVAELLPTNEDRDLTAFDRRVRRQLRDCDYGMVLNDAQAYAAELYERAKDFLAGLFQRVGHPIRSDTAIFVSRYRATPFGIHKDEYDNFLFGVLGRKRMKVWPPDAWTPEDLKMASTSDEGARGAPLEIELGVSDLLYIPAGHYHVGEADDGLAVHVSVIIGHGREHVLGLAHRQLSELLHDQLASEPLPTLYGGEGLALPAALRATCAAIEQISGDELERAVLQEWAARRSAAGFSKVPPPRSQVSLADEDVVRVDPRFPILAAARGDTTLVAVSGHVFEVPSHAGLLNLIGELNRGAPARVGTLAQRYATRAGDEDAGVEMDAGSVRDMLSIFYEMRGLAVVAGTR